MANNTYRIDLLASGGKTVTITDDGTGIDWLEIRGSYLFATDIRLNYANSNPSTQAAGLYYLPGQTNTLIVNGLIENVRGCDSADYIAGNEADNLLYGDQARTGIGANDTLAGGIGNDTAYGGSGIDSLNGGDGNDRLFGDGGNDSISGDSGADTIEGGAGADTVSGGGSVGDTVSYASSGAAVRIDITHGLTTIGNGGDAAGDQISSFLNVIGSAHDDILTDTVAATIAFGYNANLFDGQAGADTLRMGGGNDTALGGAGNDTLLGQNGKDRLTGGAGADSLEGGAGADRFLFLSQSDSTAGAAGRDTIKGFASAQSDVIDLHSLDANTTTAGVNDSFTFIHAQAFTPNVAGQLHYRAVAGGILIEGETNGIAGVDFAIFLQGVASVAASDFAL